MSTLWVSHISTCLCFPMRLFSVSFIFSFHFIFEEFLRELFDFLFLIIIKKDNTVARAPPALSSNMSNAEMTEEQVDVDLSKLIDFSVTFRPLQLTMQRVLQRLSDLEAANEQKSQEIEALNEAVRQLQQRPSNDDLLDEVNQMKELLGELQSGHEQDRLTIDELYQARKRRESVHPPATEEGRGLGQSPPVPPPLHSQEEQQQPAKKPAAQKPPLARPDSGGKLAPGRLTAEEMRSPLGDRILNKAHEDLPLLDSTARYPGEQQQPQQPVAGEEMQPPRHKTPTPTPHSAEEEERPTSNRSDPFPAARLSSRDGRRVSTGAYVPRPSLAGNLRPSMSVFDKLQRDNEDIAYLNRVVAEMLNEMKEIHRDVDQLRTEAGSPRSEELAGGRKTSEATDANVFALMKRVAQLEGQVPEVDRSSEQRDARLQEDLDQLRARLQPAARLSEADVDRVKALDDVSAKVRDLEARLAALEGQNERTEAKLESVLRFAEKGDATEISPAAFAVLSGSVDALEKQLAELQRQKGDARDWSQEIEQLQKRCAELREEAMDLQTKAEANRRECARLEDEKANKGDIPASISYEDARRFSNSGAAAGGDGGADLGELVARLADLSRRVGEAESRDRQLEENKADRNALQRLRDDVANVRRLLELAAQREQARSKEEGADRPAASAESDKLLREIQQQLLSQTENTSSQRALQQDEVSDLRELIEQLDHRKADATLVANKAERDYVENALERLMREVEQVLNATNAGLIDTLDKSLNILRDMIDGKATKQDIARLQQLMAEEGGAHTVADGLTGFKGYRCLGCNRPVDGLRPRAMAAKMNTFLNRNPQNYPQDNVTRTIQQQQQVVNSTVDRSQARPGSEPLPPIEGPK